jgi:hypothetical protein
MVKLSVNRLATLAVTTEPVRILGIMLLGSNVNLLVNVHKNILYPRTVNLQFAGLAVALEEYATLNAQIQAVKKRALLTLFPKGR